MTASNVMAMQEALRTVHNVLSKAHCDERPIPTDELVKTLTVVEEALDLPVRNCDVGTAEEQSLRCTNFCIGRLRRHSKNPCKTCPARVKNVETKCEFTWAQLPYEESK